MLGRRDNTMDGVDYKVGRKFRVIKEGARLSGMKPQPGYFSGWGQALEVGDILICQGYGAGWGSDPGYGIEWATEKSLEEHISHVDFYPSNGGAFAYRPEPGYLEPVEDES